MTRYLSAESMKTDDFGMQLTQETGEIIYDAKTRMGPWATMNEFSFKMYGLGKLGTGFGQKYVRNSAGELHKVEG